MLLTRESVRRIARAAVLTFGLLVVPGCAAPSGGGTPAETVPVESISAGIEEQLRPLDGVATVDVYYQDSLTVPESASVDLTMEPGADPQALSDEAVRLVWQSRLNPLTTIHISVIDPVEPMNGVATALNLLEDDQRRRLEKKYGPHPD